jgi:hypothetical protein
MGRFWMIRWEACGRKQVWPQATHCELKESNVTSLNLLPWHILMQTKAPYTLSVKLSNFTLWRHTWRKNWVNWAVLTGNNAGFRTVHSSRLSHRELRRSLRESHGFLILLAGTTMESCQGTSVPSNSFSRWASHDIILYKRHYLLHIFRFRFFFSDNIKVDVASKQQRQPCFYPS